MLIYKQEGIYGHMYFCTPLCLVKCTECAEWGISFSNNIKVPIDSLIYKNVSSSAQHKTPGKHPTPIDETPILWSFGNKLNMMMALKFEHIIMTGMQMTNMYVNVYNNIQTPKVIGFFFQIHSGETDEANCSWLHPVWPPPKRPDQDTTFWVVRRASTELNFCIHRDFDVRNNVYKPRRLVCECCRDISAWKSRVLKPTALRDPGRMKPTEYRDEANWISNWTDKANCW